MAEAFVSAILKDLTTILIKQARQEVKLVTGVEKQLKKLQTNFESIRTLLDDAEEKQIKEKRIQLWLDRLKQVCYDMEEVLDEWSTELLKLQIVNEVDPQTNASTSHSKGKVCRPCSIPCFSFGHQVFRRRDIALRIKQINETLDGIAKEKDRYSLSPREITRHTRRVGTTSFVDVSKLHGRDEVKKELVSSLLCGSSDEIQSDVKTVSVVGIGGMGKTALAQLIYNDGEVKTHFDERIWVCVSQDFDFVGVAKAILRSLIGEFLEDFDSLTLQILLDGICKSIEGKKVFLVLDDVWSEEGNDWGSLKQAFVAAATGSRILVTTRKIRVAETMNPFHHFFLDVLNDEACWKILCQEAFIGRAEEHCNILEDTGRKIAAKCRGLPLAARTLGSMLRFKKTQRDWEYVLNSDIWRLKLAEEEIFAPLLLSYYDLPSPIRRCFSYCSVFPKDHEINRIDLIRYWMAQGYIVSIENAEMETTGDEYFECLVSRSFFQDFKRDKEGRVFACKMHEVVVDFARFLTGNESVFKDFRRVDDEKSQSRAIEEKTRHLVVMFDKKPCLIPPRLHFGVEKLQSINIYGVVWVEFSQVLRSLCMQQKHLRSLYLKGSWVCEIPEEVGKLLHLRLLNLSQNYELKKLPEEICDLCNLQSLDVKACYSLERLPSKMEKLINLRHLDTRFCFFLKSYPKEIGKLTSLRTLRGVVVRCDRNDDEEFSLGDLENLCHLRSLSLMQMVGDAIDGGEAERANLRGKKHLAKLEVNVPSSMEFDDVIKVLNLSSSTVAYNDTSNLVQLEGVMKQNVNNIHKTKQYYEQKKVEIDKLKKRSEQNDVKIEKFQKINEALNKMKNPQVASRK